MWKWDLLLLFAAGLAAVSMAAVDDSSSDSSEDSDNALVDPSLLGMLGSKVAIADNVYDEYVDDDDELLEEDGTNRTTTTTTAAPPTPCCFPTVLQARVQTRFGFAPIGGGRRPRPGEDDDDDDDDVYFGKGKKKHGGKRRRKEPIASRAVDQVYVDGNNRRIAGNTLECHGKGKTLNFSYILLVGANRTGDLYLFNKGAQKCRYRQLKGVVWQPQCIPKNAKLRGQYSLGPAAGGLTVQSWSFQAGSKRAKAALIDGDDTGSEYDIDLDDDTRPTPQPRPKPRPKVFVSANLLVVPNTCIPVVAQEEGVVLVGGRRGDNGGCDDSNEDFRTTRKPRPRPKPKCKPHGEAFVGGAYYSDVRTTITDPSVFTVPSFCKKSPNTLFFDEMEDEIPAAIERFLVL